MIKQIFERFFLPEEIKQWKRRKCLSCGSNHIIYGRNTDYFIYNTRSDEGYYIKKICKKSHHHYEMCLIDKNTMIDQSIQIQINDTRYRINNFKPGGGLQTIFSINSNDLLTLPYKLDIFSLTIKDIKKQFETIELLR